MAKIILQIKDRTLREIVLHNSNGTFLNGARLSWKAGQTNKVSWKVALENNDKIIIAKYTLIFQDERSDYEEVKTDKQDKTVIIKM
jgi:pSer/pThr/pTyr-binding forkhead associated (FHA) protein